MKIDSDELGTLGMAGPPGGDGTSRSGKASVYALATPDAGGSAAQVSTEAAAIVSERHAHCSPALLGVH
jgi:hypothetical protein